MFRLSGRPLSRVLSSQTLPGYRISPLQAHRQSQSRQCASCSDQFSDPTQIPGLTRATRRQKKFALADHRDLATAQKLFITSPYSPGSPLFLPNGTDLFNKLVTFVRAQYPLWGFREVLTPTIYKSGLWKVSGHWENYADDMFHIVERDGPSAVSSPPTGGSGAITSNTGAGSASSGAHEAEAETESESFALKPMNCPGHCLLFASEKRSYRDLPIRYADFSPLHRNETTGALSGLTRVRRFHQDDGHIFCTRSQIESEIFATLDFLSRVYSVLGLPNFSLALSTRPESGYIGNVDEWDDAEAQLRNALDKTGQEWTVKEGDGAFYGPKIDVMLRDSDGRMHQTATVQLDFQLPRRFKLEYTTEESGEAASSSSSSSETSSAETSRTTASMGTPVMIHRAIFGSVERFLALLIEHYAGTYPFWLSPRPCAVISISNEPRTLEYVRTVSDILSGNIDWTEPPSPSPPSPSSSSSSSSSTSQPPPRPQRYNVRPLNHPSIPITTDTSDRPLGAKLRHIISQKFGFVVVVGSREVDAGVVNVRLQHVHNRDKLGSAFESQTSTGGGGGGIIVGGGNGRSPGQMSHEVRRLVQALVRQGQAEAPPEVVRGMFEYLLNNWK